MGSGMKMAKASEDDLDMAMDMAGAFDALTQRWGALVPEKAQKNPDSDKAERFDLDDPEQCKRVLEYLIGLADRASLFRVVMGMAVLLDPRNKMVDPGADVLEHHPSVFAMLAALKAVQADAVGIPGIAGESAISDKTRTMVDAAIAEATGAQERAESPT